MEEIERERERERGHAVRHRMDHILAYYRRDQVYIDTVCSSVLR